MTPFMHIVRRTKRLLGSPRSLVQIAIPAEINAHVHVRQPTEHRLLPTSGNRRRDSKVRLAAAEATLVCGRGRIAVRER